MVVAAFLIGKRWTRKNTSQIGKGKADDEQIHRTLLQGQQDERSKFEDIEEASEFWRALWEGTGSGNAGMEWIEDVREAMREAVPEIPIAEFKLTSDKVGQTVGKKNWSAPCPDLLANFWWKKVVVLHQDVARSFEATAVYERDIPLWFSGGKTSLLPKPGEFTKDNQPTITRLKTLYKWYTSCLLVDANHHLLSHGLMQGDQRRAKQDCSGTVDNLLIDCMVCQDAQRGHRNLSMAWIDVSKVYDSVDHRWLVDIFTLHRFLEWFGVLIGKLSRSWSTRIVMETKQGCESSEIIHFKKGLPQADSFVHHC